MESKQILAVILAALGVIALIAVMRAVTGADKEPEESPAESSVTSTAAFATQTAATDYWDYLRQQQETTGTDTTGTDETVPTEPEVTTALPAEDEPQTETTVSGSLTPSDETAPYIMSDAPTVATDEAPAATSEITTVTEAPVVTARTGYILHIG